LHETSGTRGDSGKRGLLWAAIEARSRGRGRVYRITTKKMKKRKGEIKDGAELATTNTEKKTSPGAEKGG